MGDALFQTPPLRRNAADGNELYWFEQDKRFKGKNVYGIICLNSPTQQLIDKVHGDKRMRLFEYQISYTEL